MRGTRTFRWCALVRDETKHFRTLVLASLLPAFLRHHRDSIVSGVLSSITSGLPRAHF